MTDDTAPTLPGMDQAAPSGEVEQATRAQIQALRDLHYIEAHHEGQAALAIVTARALDRAMTARNAASGVANLSRALREIFEALPQPEAASSDTLQQALDAIMDAEQLGQTHGV